MSASHDVGLGDTEARMALHALLFQGCLTATDLGFSSEGGLWHTPEQSPAIAEETALRPLKIARLSFPAESGASSTTPDPGVPVPVGTRPPTSMVLLNGDLGARTPLPYKSWVLKPPSLLSAT